MKTTFRNKSFFTGFSLQKAIQCKLKSQLDKNVNQFIDQTRASQLGNKIFKDALIQNLNRQTKEIKNFTRQQLTQKYSFIFDPQSLPTELRALLMITYLNSPIPQTGGKLQEYVRDLPQRIVKQTTYMAIHDSIKYNQYYLAFSYAHFIKMLQNKQLTSFVANLKNGTINFFKKWFVDKNKKTNEPLQFAQLLKAKLQLLRFYGQIIVDCQHIRQCSSKQQFGQQVLYYLPSCPTLYFRFNNSSVIVYQKINGILNQIPQSNFNYQFLKKVLQKQNIQSSGYVIRQYNNIMDGKQKQNNRKENFIKTRLQKGQFGQYLKQIKKSKRV